MSNDAKLGAKLVALVAKRNKLMAEYAANKRVRIKLQCDLDRLTSRIARLTGLRGNSLRSWRLA
jgi:hypothetical protein